MGENIFNLELLIASASLSIAFTFENHEVVSLQCLFL